MVWIAVFRGSGLHHAPAIANELITDAAVAISRGRAELDKFGFAANEVGLSAVARGGIRLGHIAEVQDEFQGEIWKGKITGIEYSMQDPVSPFVKLDIEKPNLNTPDN